MCISNYSHPPCQRGHANCLAAIELVLTNLERGDFDTRAYYFPRWLLSIAFPLSFGLMAVEFSRFVFGSELMHSGEAGIHE